MRRFWFSVLAIATASLVEPSAAYGQDAFAAGWYIVQPQAEFAVVQLAGSEVTGDSLIDASTYDQVGIARGEVVLALEQAGGTYLVLEWFGRLSAVRGTDALIKAPPSGRPAFLTEDVQFLDRIVTTGSTVWVTAIDAGAGTATVLLDGSRSESVPSHAISVLMNAYSPVLPQLTFRPVN